MIILKIGIIFSFLAVVIGAFGAHGLKEILFQNKTLDTFLTAVQYQMFHSIAILLNGILINIDILDSKIPAYCFFVGILIFSGSLYILSITNIKWLGAITPIGGVLFLIGWGLLLINLKSI